MFQQQQLLLGDLPVWRVLDFGGSKPPPYDARKQTASVMGAEGYEICARLAIIIVIQPGVLSFG